MILRYMAVQLLAIFIFFSLSFADVCNDADCAQEAIDYACLSVAAYHVHDNKTKQEEEVCDGYKLVDSWVVADSDVTWYNASLKLSGLKFGIYSKSSSVKPSIKQIIAFAGTDFEHFDVDLLRDFITDIYQYLYYSAGISVQYRAALEFVEEYKKDHSNIVLTGHSLGGGVATYVSYKTNNTPAYVFNPARVSHVLSPLASGVKAYISLNSNSTSPACDLISTTMNWGYIKFAKEFFVPIDAELTTSIFPAFNVLPLHSKDNLLTGLYDLLPEPEQPPSPPQPIYPTPIKPIIATNSPATSSPGGDAMLQNVQYGTPNGTFSMTICKKNLEGCEETWTYDCGSECRFDSDGSKTITYTPSSDKQLGYYEWWVTDQTTGDESNKGFYFIGDNASPEPWYGYYGNPSCDL